MKKTIVFFIVLLVVLLCFCECLFGMKGVIDFKWFALGEQLEDAVNKYIQNKMTNVEFMQFAIEGLRLLFIVLGGGFALYQWHKTLVYKRASVVNDMVETVRESPIIPVIMANVDWNKNFIYDGTFRVNRETDNPNLKSFTDHELFIAIDHTLVRFSYICYLRKINAISEIDMNFFDYGINRLLENEHIVNYLYSVYHWSVSLRVESSFCYLIEYGKRKGYLDRRFFMYKGKKHCLPKFARRWHGKKMYTNYLVH